MILFFFGHTLRKCYCIFLFVIVGFVVCNGQNIKSIDVAFGKGELKNAAKSYARLADKSKDQLDVYVQALYGNALAKINLEQQDAVFEILRTAEIQIRENGKISKLSEARMKIALGKYHLAYKEYDLALPLLNEGNKLSKGLGARLAVPMHLEMNQSLGDLHYDRGNYPKALIFYDQAIEVATAQPEEEINYQQLADFKMKAGEIYDKTLDPDEAIRRYKEILSQKDVLLKGQPERIGELHYKIGSVYFKRKEYEKAEDHLKEALKYKIESYDLSDAKFMLASIYLEHQEYEAALVLNGGALLNWSPEKSALPKENFKGFLQFGKLSSKQRNSSRATNNYKKMMGKEGAWSVDEELAGMNEEKITYLLNPSLSNNFNVSLLSYRQSSLVVADLPKKEQTVAEIDIQIAEGNLFFEVKNYGRAKKHFEKALELMKTVYPEKHPMVVEVSRLLSEVYLEEQIFDQAMKFIDKALAASAEDGQEAKGNGVPAIDQAKFPFELLYAIGTKGKVLKGMYKNTKDVQNLKDALNMFEGTMKLLNKLRKTYQKEGSKYQLVQLAQEFSHEAIETCYQLYENTKEKKYLHKAFDYSEIAKSSLLLEGLRDLKAREIAQIPDTVIQKENDLKVKIAYLKGEIYYEVKQGKFKDEKRLTELENELNEVKKAHEGMVLLFEKEHKKYFDLKYDYSTVSVEKIQAVLKENEQMVHYSLLDSSIIVFVLSKKEVDCYQINQGLWQTSHQLSRFLRAIKKHNLQDISHFGTLLFKHLIEPLTALKAGSDLIIIPDGLLNNLSFETLPMEVGNSFKYMLQQYAICYNYSASIYCASKEVSEKRNTGGIIGFAPDFSKMNGILDSSSFYAKMIKDLALQPLPFAIKEIEEIEKMFAENSFGAKGLEATETLLRSKANDYGVLHFATHGIVDHKDPMFSKLALMVDEESDGLLHTYELFSLEMNAEMVILSACNSGVGKLYKGEGAMSIARGFAYSGVPNMVMTLWPVSDQATYLIMTHFYKNLKEGMPKHKALQKAKITFIEDYRIENEKSDLWGGLLVVGNTDPVSCLVDKEKRSPILWWIVGSLLAIVVLLFLRQKMVQNQ